MQNDEQRALLSYNLRFRDVEGRKVRRQHWWETGNVQEGWHKKARNPLGSPGSPSL